MSSKPVWGGLSLGNNPFRTLAITAGIGYVVGGGLFSRLTVRMLGVGMRLSPRFAWIPLLSRGVGSLLQASSNDQAGKKGLSKNKTYGHKSSTKKNEDNEKGV